MMFINQQFIVMFGYLFTVDGIQIKQKYMLVIIVCNKIVYGVIIALHIGVMYI